MKRVLVNGLKSRTGGGRSILHNYLALLTDSRPESTYFVLTPDASEFRRYVRDNVRIIDVFGPTAHNAFFPLLYGVEFPRLLRRHEIDTILNLGDIPVPAAVRQLMLFDWPHALYPGSEVWNAVGVAERGYFKIKLLAFRAWARHVDLFLAQTETAKTRLERLFNLTNVRVVPNAVSLDNFGVGLPGTKYRLPADRVKLLYLSHWYTNKNHEILLPVARKIVDHERPWSLVTTISGDQHPRAAAFLERVEREGLGSALINLGPIAKEDVPGVYRSCDALVMPTLLESFSGSYVEAMHHGLPVFTSDLDFAHDVCGEAGTYFDPLSADSIYRTLDQALADQRVLEQQISIGRRRVAQMPTWPQVFEKIQHLLVGTSTEGTE